MLGPACTPRAFVSTPEEASPSVKMAGSGKVAVSPFPSTPSFGLTQPTIPTGTPPVFVDHHERHSCVLRIVRSTGLRDKPFFPRPPADKYAKAVVGLLGCGRRVVVPWYPHDVMMGILSLVVGELQCTYI